MLLILLIIVLALVGGFLGSLLEFAFWLIVVLAIVGATLGFLVHKLFTSMKS